MRRRSIIPVIILASGLLLFVILTKKKNGNGVTKSEEAEDLLRQIEEGYTDTDQSLEDIINDIQSMTAGSLPNSWSPEKDADMLWDSRCQIMVFGACLTTAGTNETKLIKSISGNSRWQLKHIFDYFDAMQLDATWINTPVSVVEFLRDELGEDDKAQVLKILNSAK